MFKKLQTIGQTVHDGLWGAERSYDTSIMETADLLGTLLRARGELRSGVGLGAELVDQAFEVLQVQREGRRALVELHRRAAEFKERTAFRTIGFGASGPKEDVVWAPLVGVASETEAA